LTLIKDSVVTNYWLLISLIINSPIKKRRRMIKVIELILLSYERQLIEIKRNLWKKIWKRKMNLNQKYNQWKKRKPLKFKRNRLK
jgi:hypothetical protein